MVCSEPLPMATPTATLPKFNEWNLKNDGETKRNLLFQWLILRWSILHFSLCTLPETNSQFAPENGPPFAPKGNAKVFQPSIPRGYVYVRFRWAISLLGKFQCFQVASLKPYFGTSKASVTSKDVKRLNLYHYLPIYIRVTLGGVPEICTTMYLLCMGCIGQKGEYLGNKLPFGFSFKGTHIFPLN